MNYSKLFISLLYFCASVCATTSYSSSYNEYSEDTVGSPDSRANGNQVIVFVHGFRGFANPSQLEEDIAGSEGFNCEMGIQQLRLDDTGAIIDKEILQPYMIDEDDKGMPIWLVESGFDVWFAHYTSNPAGTLPLAENAACLAQQIAEVSGYDAEGKVTIIAASLGGLVSRYYLENEALFHPYADNVEKIFTLGSPHKGLPIGALVYLAEGLGMDCSVGQSPGCEITRKNMRRLNRKKRALGVDYYFIGGEAPKSNFEKKLNQWIYSALRLWGKNDGLVLSRSARGMRSHFFDRKIRGVTGRLLTDESHAPNIGNNSYTAPRTNGAQSKAYLLCVKPVLIGGDIKCV
ncbi:MAG: hypothetical protein KUG82_06135 [Pseudomonadales bacterium]|nr:hypothetical protein [Pseudomonadales bacterium]